MKRRNTTACLHRAGAPDSIERHPALFGRGCGTARSACCAAIAPGGRHQCPGARLGRSAGFGAVGMVPCKGPSPLHFQCSTLSCPAWRIPEVCQATCRHYSGATATVFHWRTDAPSVAAFGAKIRRRNAQSYRVLECLGLIPSSIVSIPIGISAFPISAFCFVSGIPISECQLFSLPAFAFCFVSVVCRRPSAICQLRSAMLRRRPPSSVLCPLPWGLVVLLSRFTVICPLSSLARGIAPAISLGLPRETALDSTSFSLIRHPVTGIQHRACSFSPGPFPCLPKTTASG